jgi:hypothetical protein
MVSVQNDDPDDRPPARAILMADQARKVSREFAESHNRYILHERRPRGYYTKLKAKLESLDGGSVLVPFQGDARAARELLTALCRSLTARDRRWRYVVHLSDEGDAFYVSRNRNKERA